jgi:hypothetical protein
MAAPELTLLKSTAAAAVVHPPADELREHVDQGSPKETISGREGLLP